jgi:hypothetical protein
MFNQCRGYNAYNIPLAILFEKYLDENGAFDSFKTVLLEEENFDWTTDAADVVTNELNTILRVAKSSLPRMDIEALKATLLNKENYYIDALKFTTEVQNYLKTKEDNYRCCFWSMKFRSLSIPTKMCCWTYNLSSKV